MRIVILHINFSRPPVTPKTPGGRQCQVYSWKLDDFRLTWPPECGIIGVKLRGRQFRARKPRKPAGIGRTCFNLTRMECKYNPSSRHASSVRVLILPEWNVNQYEFDYFDFELRVLILPEWNVNTLYFPRTFAKPMRFNLTRMECKFEGGLFVNVF